MNHLIHNSSCDITPLPYDITADTGNPKFASLYFNQTNCGLIFLKQKSRQIKPKFINCEKKNCSICRNKTLAISKNDISCAFFDPSGIYFIISY